jgi:glucuronate isomerase
MMLADNPKSGEHVSMALFLGEDFLLNTETSRRLYHEHAKPQPIFDYHTHLSAADIAADRKFNNLYEIWLEGDHYKWRAMRTYGGQMPESFCTGDSSPYEKFIAWARTVPHTVANPLYHWTHLELQRYFGITDLLSAATAPAIWKQANAILEDGLTARAILRKFNVKAVFTTDDPTDDLAPHATLAELAPNDLPGRSQRKFDVAVLPTFRPDKALLIDQPAIFLPWLQKLEEASNTEVRNLATFLDALRKRHKYFSEHGCRASDHGLVRCPAKPCTEAEAARTFARALASETISAEDQERYATFLMSFFADLNVEMGWVMQLHLGALRNASSVAAKALGPDTGFDAIGDYPQGLALATFLDHLQRENALPKTVLYNSNPADNHVFATLAGSFRSSRRGITTNGPPQVLQWGPPWWFMDQERGITEHLNCLSSVGLLSRFIGMTTDSRSFLSFPRHEYFRRILCDLLGTDVERGEVPDDDSLLAPLIANVCYGNAERYFATDSDQVDGSSPS